MMTMNDIGKLMHLPIADIKPGKPVHASPYVVQAAAAALQQANGHNWVPLIVKQIDRYTYEVISNGLVYAIAQAAGLERVWCVITDASPETVELTHILAGEQLPKVNLCTASQAEILAALQFVSEQSSALKGLDITAAAEKLASAKRLSWQDFSAITKLGKFKSDKSEVAISRTKLKALSTVFYLLPSEPVVQPPILQPIKIKQASRNEIFQQLKQLAEAETAGFDKLDLEKIADEIFTEPKTKWTSLNPITTKLKCGVTPTQVKALRLVFTL
jgi:hypothetical protein